MNNLKQKAYNVDSSFVIALDGPSAAGKGLIGKMLAEEFHLEYVQSSIVYRGLAYLCINSKINSADKEKIIEISKLPNLLQKLKNIDDLNKEIVGNYASKISIIPEVRSNLNRYLLNFLQTKKRIVMEGRDIGTVLATDADLKIFITADVTQRAKRRYEQLRKDGKECMLDDVLKLLKERDLRDSSREHAPLQIAADAFVIDTTDILPEQVMFKIKEHIRLSSI